jgi:iron complex outermembrane recepter protein
MHIGALMFMSCHYHSHNLLVGEGFMKARMRNVLGCFLGVLLIASLTATGQAETTKAPADQKATASTDKKEYEAFDLGELYVKGETIQGVQQMTQVSEFTAEQIEKTNSKTVAEALSYVPGVVVTTGRKNEPNVSIHGISQGRALILIDGVPYYETTYGKLDLGSIPVDNVARIEVQKGVSSVLYGPNNTAGVINIITKKPTSRPSLEARAEIGDYRASRFDISHGMKVGMFNYWFGYGHQESKGWYMSRSFDSHPTTISGLGTVELENGGVRENSDQKTDSIWAKVGIEPTSSSEYYLNFHYITREKGGPASLLNNVNQYNLSRPAFTNLWRFPTYDSWGIDLSGQQKPTDRVTLKAKVFYHSHADELESFSDINYENELSQSRYQDYTLGTSFLADIKIASIDTLRLAFNYRKDNHEERADEYLPFAQSSSYTGSFGLENEFNPIKNLSIVGGISYDWFEVTKAEKNNTNGAGDFTYKTNYREPYKNLLNPMLGATYKLSDSTKLFASGAKKVRFPTLTNLYGGRNPNPGLKPETSTNYVAGVSRDITQYTRVEASYFEYNFRDLIQRDAPDRNAPYRNVGKVQMRGFEVLGEVFPTKDLTLKLGYTYNDATDKTRDNPTKRVLYVPEHQVNLGLSYLVPVIDTKLDVTGLYLSSIWGQLPSKSRPTDVPLRTGATFTMDVRVSKMFLKNFEIYFTAKNIFDRDYESEIGFPAPGRNLYTGIKYSY